MGANKRRVYLFPAHIIDPLEKEANRRIVQSGRVGKANTGAVARDILCVCIAKALTDIIEMSSQEVAAAIKDAKRNKR